MGADNQMGFLFPPAAAARKVWSVRELVSNARTTVERQFSDVWVEGEISNYRPADSGHLYFTLKDGESQLRVVMFGSRARLLRFRPDNGMQIIARGRVTIYDARGELQLAAEFLEPKGAGALQVAFEQLKNKLAAEGLFDRERKRPIPGLPKRIGIVTSPRGAAVHDMLNILRRRHATANVLIFPAQVQGETAAAEVAAGVKFFNRKSLPDAQRVDVIVVARGGGSAEDLAAFNDEALARTIAASEVPVISAVGHETDFTIADFVADLRAPTPSAAAELVIESEQRLQERIQGLRQRLARASRYRFVVARNRLTNLARHGAFARMADAIARRHQRVDDLSYRLSRAQGRILAAQRRRVDVAAARVRHHDIRRVLGGVRRELSAVSGELAAQLHRHMQQKRSRLEQLQGRLRALSPHNILQRGYSLVFDAEGTLVRDAARLRPGDRITARFATGSAKARVEDVEDTGEL